MAKFRIELCRVREAFQILDIEAEDEFKAAQKALEVAGNFSFSEESSDYTVESCDELIEG
jgi:hypothetical protein